MQTARKMILSAYKQRPTECMVELEFDLERALNYLGERAFANKSKKTKCGFIKVTVRPTERGKQQMREHRVDRPWWLNPVS